MKKKSAGARRKASTVSELRKKLRAARRALIEADEKFLMLAEKSPNMIFINASGRIVYANRQCEEVLGYRRREFYAPGFDFFSIIHPDYHRLVQSKYAFHLKGRDVKPYEYALLAKDGRRVDGVLSSKLITYRGKEAILGIVTDLTERKKDRAALDESEALYRSLFESAPIGIGVAAEDGRLLAFNDAMLGPGGYTRKEIEKIGTTTALYHDTRERDRVLEEVRNKGSVHRAEVRFKRRDGTPYAALLSLSRITFHGRPHWHAMVEDVTEKEAAEARLRESEELYRSLVETSPNAIVLSDLAGNILMVNRRAAEIYGIERPDEIRGVNAFDFVSPDQRNAALAFSRKLFEEGGVMNQELFLPRKNGPDYPAEINASLVMDQKGNPRGFVAVIRDMTERKKTEEELLRARKLESLGILAGGMAHDFNNILTAILGNLSMARLQVGEGSAAQARIMEAEKASLMARNLTRKLLTFSKGGAPVKKSVPTADLIRDVSAIVTTGARTVIEQVIPEGIWPMDVDQDQISQVIHNLLINARQSMPEGGRITVAAGNVAVGSDSAPPPAPGRYVMISVQDSGDGIPEDILPRIFDPYFTTRAQGSGLGLATSYSIVQRHGGHITVESRPGQGTTFHVYLAAAEDAPSCDEPPVTPSSPEGMRILVMDDEPMVQKVSRRMLEHLGCEAVFASNGRDAVELYRKALAEGQGFHAVIMDLTIPGGMGGKEAMAEILKIDPDARGLASSGYSNDPVMSSPRDFGFCGCIAKPFSIEELGRVLDRIVGR
jgi:PAS domain S-box-containing protein